MLIKLQTDLSEAVRGSDSLRVLVLRGLLSELNYKKIDLQRELTNEEVLGVIAKEVKKRKEAIDSFTAGGRLESAESELKEMNMLKTYLPELMSEDEIKSKLMSMNLSGDIGSVMRIVSPEFKGKADMGVVSRLVKEICQ